MGEWRYIPPFLPSSLDGGKWSVSHLGSFTRGEKSASYPLDRGLRGTQSRSGRCGDHTKDSTCVIKYTPLHFN
jgi:hypothetical protein